MAIGTAFIILPLLWLAKVEAKNKRLAKQTDAEKEIDIALPKQILATNTTGA